MHSPSEILNKVSEPTVKACARDILKDLSSENKESMDNKYEEFISVMKKHIAQEHVIQKLKERNNAKKVKKVKKRPALEDCTLDAVKDCNCMILPNSIQLVESELPLSEADNYEYLMGAYLFRQIFSSYDNRLQCLLCRNEYNLDFFSREDLIKHYALVHDIFVKFRRAIFSEDIVFICVPSDVGEETTVNSVCQFCDTALKSLAEMRSHYPNAHNKTVKVFPESKINEIGNFFYCGLCGRASDDFLSHRQHMKVQHGMKTFMCRYCTYCTDECNHLRTHVQQKHLQDQPHQRLQCSVCSVYVHGRDWLIKHTLSHSAQTGFWKLQQRLREVVPNGKASDVVLKVEGQEFKAHRCILAAGSPVFLAMMTDETQEIDIRVIDIDDVDAYTMSAFLGFLYNGSLKNIASQNVVKLYTAADKYQVDELKHDCVNYMLKNISIDNFCDIFTLSLRHVEKDLINACTQFFIKNSLSIVLTSEWLTFLDENPIVGNELFNKRLRIK